jgi:myo-inositol-1(or 4)-monophosphatase
MRLAGDPATVPGGRMAHSLRSVGSAALNFCLVSSGALDVYAEAGCWPWDVCAGAVIAGEAGALVSGGPQAAHDGVVGEEILMGRKYIVVRAVADSEVRMSMNMDDRMS